MIYDNITHNAHYSDKVFFNLNFVNGAKLSIDGCDCHSYYVKFYDHNTNTLIYNTTIKGGMWTKPSKEYFIKWRVEAYKEGNLVFKSIFDCTNKRVYINLGSKALGDTIAWFPYVEEFRKQHNCKVVCSTFHNEWFKKEYPEIEFTQPGEGIKDVYASYNIGWFYNDEGIINLNKNKFDPKHFPLQKTASDILGLSYKETPPKIYVEPQPKEIQEPYVVIAPHGSKHASYWNYPGGWQQVIDWLDTQGYKTVMLSREPLGDKWHDSKLGGTLQGVINKTGDNSFQEVFNLLSHSQSFIGTGSGLTWINWALNKPTILISGFSDSYTEMQNCIRLSASPKVCNGCFNTHKLDPGDWEWCPHHKNTSRHFECSKSITPEMVIDGLKKTLNIY